MFRTYKAHLESMLSDLISSLCMHLKNNYSVNGHSLE